MAYPYITQTDLESAVSPAIVRRALDDDRDGTADSNAITRVLASASAKVAGYLRGIYDLAAVASAPPEEVKRLTLDVAEAMLAKRHPEVTQKNWRDLMEQADKELKALRRGDTRLDVEGSPEPAANQGVDYSVGDPDLYDEDEFEPYFSWGTGDF